jgi:hypothetical protein
MKFLYKTNNTDAINNLAEVFQGLNDKHPGKEVAYSVEVKLNRAIRSNDQNARYWVILQEIAVQSGSGNTADDLHEFYKMKFNSKWIIDEHVPQSTTKLDTKDFTIYMNQVEEHARSFFNCVFKNPGDDRYIEWMEGARERYNGMFVNT